jgi:hypothetical protein
MFLPLGLGFGLLTLLWLDVDDTTHCLYVCNDYLWDTIGSFLNRAFRK